MVRWRVKMEELVFRIMSESFVKLSFDALELDREGRMGEAIQAYAVCIRTIGSNLTELLSGDGGGGSSDRQQMQKNVRVLNYCAERLCELVPTCSTPAHAGAPCHDPTPVGDDAPPPYESNPSAPPETPVRQVPVVAPPAPSTPIQQAHARNQQLLAFYRQQLAQFPPGAERDRRVADINVQLKRCFNDNIAMAKELQWRLQVQSSGSQLRSWLRDADAQRLRQEQRELRALASGLARSATMPQQLDMVQLADGERFWSTIERHMSAQRAGGGALSYVDVLVQQRAQHALQLPPDAADHQLAAALQSLADALRAVAIGVYEYARAMLVIEDMDDAALELLCIRAADQLLYRAGRHSPSGLPLFECMLQHKQRLMRDDLARMGGVLAAWQTRDAASFGVTAAACRQLAEPGGEALQWALRKVTDVRWGATLLEHLDALEGGFRELMSALAACNCAERSADDLVALLVYGVVHGAHGAHLFAYVSLLDALMPSYLSLGGVGYCVVSLMNACQYVLFSQSQPS